MLKRWENFQIASLEMNNILEEQKNRIQGETIKKTETLEQEAARLYKKYEQMRPSSEEMSREQVLDIYGKIKDWQAEWNEVEDKFKAIEADIKHFNMRMPEFKSYKQIKKNLSVEMGNWLLFMEYRAEIEKLEKEEWITFRGNLNKYADIVSEYSNRAKAVTNVDSVAKFFRDFL